MAAKTEDKQLERCAFTIPILGAKARIAMA